MAREANVPFFLYGPPGTGKATLAHAMAREANVPFFCISACYIRTGDVRIKSLFDEARRRSPSIVFIDYVDEIASQRENCDSDCNLVEVNKIIRNTALEVKQLHNEMDKCNKDGSMVVVIAATDSPEALDSTFMSSCQFYKTFHVAKPDEDSRQKKAGFCFKDLIMEEDKEAICNLVASQTAGLSWANLENIAVEFRVAAKYRGGGRVTIDDVREAIRGFHFGKFVSGQSYSSGDIKFKSRVFPKKHGVKLYNLDLVGVLEDEEYFGKLFDEDAVRVCLLLVLEVIFMGRLLTDEVDDKLLRLVDDLQAWNSFPWGENIWRQLYNQLLNVVSRHRFQHLKGFQSSSKFVPTYTLSGFVWAFQSNTIFNFMDMDSRIIPKKQSLVE
ncbi:ATPase, AAA-type, core, P-loop containing nucleoside triphosphate hydrolase [Artemisia annua]|uniref:ATPase, AAA-type, core, P-loop containing nucleoside triphosphate hydrolase n=1 Tax=Artemisia annua TaxID=35608 RepID=A0A2U1KF37_ARTAN|nr:ATPase, AAA-type, core, P-loop containing nucleoside triphosphate hydrolase [Artemisia annua]